MVTRRHRFDKIMERLVQIAFVFMIVFILSLVGYTLWEMIEWYPTNVGE